MEIAPYRLLSNSRRSIRKKLSPTCLEKNLRTIYRGLEKCQTKIDKERVKNIGRVIAEMVFEEIFGITFESYEGIVGKEIR